MFEKLPIADRSAVTVAVVQACANSGLGTPAARSEDGDTDDPLVVLE